LLLLLLLFIVVVVVVDIAEGSSQVYHCSC